MTSLRLALASMAALVSAFAAAQDVRPFSLLVGDPAPPLTVSKWVKGQPITAYKPGQIYVVEFWATWCKPCIAAIPHLTELQKKHGEKVRFIGVDVWETELAKVEPFVKQMGAKMDYTVAMDQVPAGGGPTDGAMAKTWLAAAGRTGIPASFVVDGNGKIAWIGHPMELDVPLEKIVAGTWNAQADLKENMAKLEAAAAEQKRQAAYTAAMDSKNADEAIRLAEEAIAAGSVVGYTWKAHALAFIKNDVSTALKAFDAQMALGGDHARRGATSKVYLLLQLQDFSTANAIARELVEGPFKDNARGISSTIVTLTSSSWSDPSKIDLDFALTAMQRAVSLEKADYTLSNLAQVYFLRGEKAKAIDTQKQAIAVARNEEMKRNMEATLKKYETGK